MTWSLADMAVMRELKALVPEIAASMRTDGDAHDRAVAATLDAAKARSAATEQRLAERRLAERQRIAAIQGGGCPCRALIEGEAAAGKEHP